MPRILACTTGPGDWKGFLADPDKQWKTGHSAKALALSWEAANGLPLEVMVALDSAPPGTLQNAIAYLAVPEYRTELPGGDRPSQTDLMVIGRAQGGAFVMAVEGKVAESFGPTLGDWRKDASEGKKQRWSFLCATLGIQEDQPSALRYQLFHRATAAVLAARLHHSPLAALMVHSFSSDDAGYSDFAAFLKLFGGEAKAGSMAPLATLGDTRLIAGWARGDLRHLRE